MYNRIRSFRQSKENYLSKNPDRKRLAITWSAGLFSAPWPASSPCSSLFTLYSALPDFSSRLIVKPDHLGLNLAHLLQFFSDVFHLLLLPGLDEFYFFLGIVEFDVGVHIEGDGYVAVAHQVLEGLGTDPG